MEHHPFKLSSEFEPQGDQPQAIKKIADGVKAGKRHQTLLGATGTGKTFTMSNVIKEVGKPTLIIAHNKTLAGQLYSEFKEFFPENRVEYFVSYYDYYQPEAYVPSTDTFIEKDASINDEIDQLRHSATSALFERDDVIIIASVSCIYGLGNPKEYRDLVVSIRVGMEMDRSELLRKLVDVQYTRNDIDFQRGTFRVRGDVVEIFPASREEMCIRVEFFGDEIDRIREVNYLTGEVLRDREHFAIFPASHFVTRDEKMKVAIQRIDKELEERLEELRSENKLLEAQRLEQRTNYDLEMMREMGFCSGIENYSVHLTLRPLGSTPYTLLDYFGDDWLVMIDESHVTLPQIRGMYNGDRARKQVLVDHGFRLPSAMDNRPLQFEEFEEKTNQLVYVSATPGPYEMEHTDEMVEQIIRPTGLLDPKIDVRPTAVSYTHSLLRKGLDIPEVSLVVILDADKEGFLRSERSLVQTIGRAARNSEGEVIMYGDKITDSMQHAIDETQRRREIQMKFNEEHNITPTTINKKIHDVISATVENDDTNEKKQTEVPKKMSKKEREKTIDNIEKEMKQAAKDLDFEKATELRDMLFELKAEG